MASGRPRAGGARRRPRPRRRGGRAHGAPRRRAHRRPGAPLAEREVFVHLDVDILDPTVMPATLPGARRPRHDAAARPAGGRRRPGAYRRRRDHLLLDPRAQRRAGAGRRAAAGEPRTMSTDAAPSILRPLVEDLHERRAKAKLGGGEEKIAKQHAADKLTARERLDLLVDPGTFTELGLHAGIHYSVRAWRARRRRPTASSPATARSTAGWSRWRPTTSRSWPARWA